MENDIPVAVEAYRQPESKVVLKAMTDPRPHKLAVSYLKARVRQILGHQKQALWTRPVDDVAYVGKELVRTTGATGGAVAGSRLGALVSQGNPYASIAGAILGGVMGARAGEAVGKKFIDGGIAAADAAGVIPESMKYVDIASKRQGTYSNVGSALGIASVVPLAARVMMRRKTSPLLAVAGSLGSAYLMSRIGNAAGNMAGYYVDRAYDEES